MGFIGGQQAGKGFLANPLANAAIPCRVPGFLLLIQITEPQLSSEQTFEKIPCFSQSLVQPGRDGKQGWSIPKDEKKSRNTTEHPKEKGSGPEVTKTPPPSIGFWLPCRKRKELRG